MVVGLERSLHWLSLLPKLLGFFLIFLRRLFLWFRLMLLYISFFYFFELFIIFCHWLSIAAYFCVFCFLSKVASVSSFFLYLHPIFCYIQHTPLLYDSNVKGKKIRVGRFVRF